MEYIKKEELIKGEVYHVKDGNFWMIGLIIKGNNGRNDYSLRGDATYITSANKFKINECWAYKSKTRTYRLATPEEKHWLESCILANEFIEFDEAMKTFIPEYVECIGLYGGAKIGTIYKTSNNEEARKMFSLYWDKVLIYYKNLNTRFKPSTKEAYDDQFVVKEPKFVLPEKWCLKITNENIDFCRSLKNKELGMQENYFYFIGGYYSSITTPSGLNGFINIPNNYTEITFEQFKKYVLKEETVEYPINTEVLNTQTNSIYIKKENGWYKASYKTGYTDEMIAKSNYINIIEKTEIIEPLPQFKVIESIETITKVENNEGSQFFIGDIVKSLNSNQRGKITKFKYSNDKSDIIAITTFQQTNGISINKIEHYVETKVESINRTAVNIAKNSHYGLYPLTSEKCYQSNESFLDKAKRLYPIGTIVKSFYFNDKRTIKTDAFKEKIHTYIGKIIYADDGYISIYSEQKDKWVEIIEYPHSFKIGDKIKIKTTGDLNIYKIINIEGDVLFYHTDDIHYKNHCRVLAKNAIKVN